MSEATKPSSSSKLSADEQSPSSKLSADGWTTSPQGWNLIDSLEYDDQLVSGNLNDYNQDYIMVLAGGLDHLGRNHPWVKDRLDVAHSLYKIRPRKIIILGGGTYHKPPHINRERYVIHESTMGAKYLIDLGVSPNDIYREWASYDTIANGFFSLINFVIPMNIENILVITSDFHMPRSKAVFNWIYQLWDNQSRDEHTDHSTKLSFLEVSTRYLDRDIIEARASRENRSLTNLQKTAKRITDFQQFHNWFYQEHQAYNCHFQSPATEHMDERIRKTY